MSNMLFRLCKLKNCDPKASDRETKRLLRLGKFKIESYKTSDREPSSSKGEVT
jgi:hypothetical protein